MHRASVAINISGQNNNSGGQWYSPPRKIKWCVYWHNVHIQSTGNLNVLQYTTISEEEDTSPTYPLLHKSK